MLKVTKVTQEVTIRICTNLVERYIMQLMKQKGDKPYEKGTYYIIGFSGRDTALCRMYSAGRPRNCFDKLHE